MSTQSLEKYFHSFDLNYYESCKIVCDHMKKGGSLDLENKIVTYCGLSISFFNNVFLKQANLDQFQDWAETIKLFIDKNHDYQLVISDRFAPPSQKDLLDRHLKSDGKIPAMVFDSEESRLNMPTVLSQMEIKKVVGKTESDAFRSIAGPSFEMPDYIADRIITDDFCLDERHQLYVGYYLGQPVSTSMLYISHGVAGIYWVATAKEYRGRGFAEALTFHACSEGLKVVPRFRSLQASQLGEPVYKRMEFKTIYQYNKYLSVSQ